VGADEGLSPVTGVAGDPVPAPASGLAALARLDALLARGVAAAHLAYGADAAADAFRGLYVSAEQAERALDGAAARPLVTGREPVRPGWAAIAADDPGWAWLREHHPLTDLDLDVVLLALGPEVDRRYERLYGYLQDDVNRRRPTVDLALDLLTGTVEERLAARGAFGTAAPLLAERLIRLVPDPRVVAPPLLAHVIVPDEQVVDALLGRPAGLDRRLTGACRLTTPHNVEETPETALAEDDLRALRRAVGAAWGARPLLLHLRGPEGSGQGAVAATLAASVGGPLLELDLAALPADDTAPEIVALAVRAAALHGALLHVRDVPAVRTPEHRATRAALAEHLARHRGVVLLSGAQPWAPLGREPLGVLEIPCALDDARSRRGVWVRALHRHGVPAPADVLDALADRFVLGPARIEDAVRTALAAAHWRAAAAGAPTRAAPTGAELFAAARRQTGEALAALARRVDLVHGWSDLVLPDDSTAALHEMCSRVAHRRRVLSDWCFGRAMSHGKGISALFHGPPGTGKTMAAAVIARELGLDLFAIDLAGVVDKYIGETEKNLERLFTAAEESNAILLFDEADALFGKRSDVRDSHDRYANIEISYLLQRMEQYEGLTILATNLRQHLDDAFTRRLQFVVEFPFPDDAERARIWKVCFPHGVPRDPDIDLPRLARDYRLAGGNIRNIVLGAAFLAADDDTPVTMAHLLAATRREHQKMGRLMPASSSIAASSTAPADPDGG
jgi:hypothetical protein